MLGTRYFWGTQLKHLGRASNNFGITKNYVKIAQQAVAAARTKTPLDPNYNNVEVLTPARANAWMAIGFYFSGFFMMIFFAALAPGSHIIPYLPTVTCIVVALGFLFLAIRAAHDVWRIKRIFEE